MTTEWRARLGVLVPSANAVMERDAKLLLPAGVSAHFARMPLTRDDEIQIESLFETAPAAAATLVDAAVDILGFGCTTGSLLGGKGYDKLLIDRLKRGTGIPATTTSTAVLAALASLQVSRLLLISPYPDWLTAKVIDFLRQHSVEVVSEYHWSYPEPRNAEAVTPAEIVDAAIQHVEPGTDGVFISCTGFRGLEACQAIEAALKIPAVSSNQATYWHMLRSIGIADPVSGFGQLLSTSGHELEPNCLNHKENHV